MKLEFLGTGAADYNLEHDRQKKEYRRFSSTLVNDTLLIDPGPHIFDYIETYGKQGLLDNVQTVIITHSHGDHMNMGSIAKLLEICPNCVFAGNAVSGERMAGLDPKIPYTVMELYREYTFGDYTVTALPANHFTGRYDEIALHFAITQNGQKLFYGTDGGWLPAPTWDYLRGKKFDAMVFELTIGIAPGDDRIFTHTSIPMLEIMLQTVRKQRAIELGGKVYVTHMAKTLHPDQASLAAMLAPLNVTPSYDGYVTEF